MPTLAARPPSVIARPVAVDVTPAPAAALVPEVGYFDRQWPAAAILGAFPFVTLPIAAALIFSPANALIWLYVWLFGVTHFVITLTIYLQSGNLRYFAATPRNRIIFFLIPAAIFIGFDLIQACRLSVVVPVVAGVLFAIVRLADFHHLNRQSFGVLQLFKARGKGRFPMWMKKAENAHFLTLTVLLFVTFLSGGMCPLLLVDGPLTLWSATPLVQPVLPVMVAQFVWLALLAINCGFMAVLFRGLRQPTSGGKPRAASAYFLVQSACALLPAVYLPLYLATLAVHYVEYHVLMAPRCLYITLNPASRVDRVFACVRRQPVIFYMLVIAVAGLVTMLTAVGMGMMGAAPGAADEPFGYLALIAVFDGLFVFHYFVEAFIWRFSDAHFRASLAGLYFPAPPQPARA